MPLVPVQNGITKKELKVFDEVKDSDANYYAF